MPNSDAVYNLAIILLAVATSVAAIIEVILSRQWNPSYFRSGIPIFLRRFPATVSYPEPLPLYDLEDRFRSKITYSLAFRQISATEYAFRPKLEFAFRLGYRPMIMRGLILCDFDRQQVIVKGHVNWAILLGVILILVMCIGRSFLIIVIPAVFLGLFYGIEAWRFSEVGNFAAECWSWAATD